jgi:hypothetical protein
MNIIRSLFTSVLLLGTMGWAEAQIRQQSAIDTVGAQQTRQRFEQVDPAGFPEEQKKTVILDDTEDFGRQVLLKPTRTRPYVEAITGHDLIYSDNVALTPDNIRGSWMWIGNFLIRGYVPLPEKWDSLTATLDIQETFYRYENNTANQLDFNRDAASFNLTYNFRNAWIGGIGYGVNQLRSNSSSINTFYSEGVVNWNLTRPFPISDDQVIFAGYYGEYHHTSNSNPIGSFDRVTSAFVLGYNYQFLPRVMGQALYKLQGDGYTQPTLDGALPGQPGFGRLNNNRFDVNNMLTVALIYTPTEWCTVRTSFTATFNDSNDTDRNYTNLQGGGNVQLTFRY